MTRNNTAMPNTANHLVDKIEQFYPLADEQKQQLVDACKRPTRTSPEINRIKSATQDFLSAVANADTKIISRLSKIMNHNTKGNNYDNTNSDNKKTHQPL